MIQWNPPMELFKGFWRLYRAGARMSETWLFEEHYYGSRVGNCVLTSPETEREDVLIWGQSDIIGRYTTAALSVLRSSAGVRTQVHAIVHPGALAQPHASQFRGRHYIQPTHRQHRSKLRQDHHLRLDSLERSCPAENELRTATALRRSAYPFLYRHSENLTS